MADLMHMKNLNITYSRSYIFIKGENVFIENSVSNSLPCSGKKKNYVRCIYLCTYSMTYIAITISELYHLRPCVVIDRIM